ncbi:MAG: SGNH/GDSL hydrolase family protein [Lachnospiraceae bacterium]|nr:SGNH/GDSL hydrolase family protein [Lachnospiraceae bacterium]
MKKKYTVLTVTLLILIGILALFLVVLTFNTEFKEDVAMIPEFEAIDDSTKNQIEGERENSKTELDTTQAEDSGVNQGEIHSQKDNNGSYWSGKKAIMLGDSIVDYDGDVNMYDVNEIIVGYTHYLYELGFEYIDNQGHDGAGIAFHDSGGKDVCSVVNNINFSEYDLVIISAGVNDFLWLCSPLGDIDNENFDIECFYGAYQYILTKIRSDNPNAIIVITTPLRCDSYASYQEYNACQLNLEAYANAIKEIGKKYDIGVIDLFSLEEFNQNMRIYTLDGLHPNNDGYEIISEECLVPFIKSLKSE